MSIFGPTVEPKKGTRVVYANAVKEGQIPSGYDAYFDFNGGWHAEVTLPKTGKLINKHLTLIHRATLNTNINIANTNLTVPLKLTVDTKYAVFSWTGVCWIFIKSG